MIWDLIKAAPSIYILWYLVFTVTKQRKFVKRQLKINDLNKELFGLILANQKGPITCGCVLAKNGYKMVRCEQHGV